MYEEKVRSLYDNEQALWVSNFPIKDASSNLACAIIFVERVLQPAISFLHGDCILLAVYDVVIFLLNKKNIPSLTE
jgi:hypothetical protein